MRITLHVIMCIHLNKIKPNTLKQRINLMSKHDFKTRFQRTVTHTSRAEISSLIPTIIKITCLVFVSCFLLIVKNSNLL